MMEDNTRFETDFATGHFRTLILSRTSYCYNKNEHM